MLPDAGERQEHRLFDYLRFRRHCVHVIKGDEEVRSFLGMKGRPKCADALGFHQSLTAAGPKRVTVAESKGTDMGSAMKQLGNAAAGVFEMFGRETNIDLCLMVPGLQELHSGVLSPGNGYLALPMSTGLGKFTLYKSIGGPPLLASPEVTYPEWAKWALMVRCLRIAVLTSIPRPKKANEARPETDELCSGECAAPRIIREMAPARARTRNWFRHWTAKR